MATLDDQFPLTQLTSVTVMRSSAAERNKDAILEVIKTRLVADKPMSVLEIASGTGQHVAHFAAHLPQVTWQPSECEQKSVTSIQGYIQITQRQNIRDPVWINTRDIPDTWGNSSLDHASFDMVLCINLLHFCEWAVTEGLFKGCALYLKPGGILATYGPYKVNGEISPESNVQFDRMLRQQNVEWGLRDTEDLQQQAHQNNMDLENIIDMPSNHKMLVFRKKT